MALYFSKGLLKPLEGTPIYSSVDSALQKIGAALPAQSFQFLRGLDQTVSVRTAGFKDYSQSRDVLDVLTRCVRHKFTTRVNHRTAQFEKGIEREVDPYRLWYVNNGIYLVGHDHRSAEIGRSPSRGLRRLGQRIEGLKFPLILISISSLRLRSTSSGVNHRK